MPILPDWFTTDNGLALLDRQIKCMPSLVPDQFYQVGLQIGGAHLPIVNRFNVEHSLILDSSAPADVVALPEALPLSEHSVDLALLLHTLDYCDDPHHALREIYQVMRPEGVLLFSGFHPYSLWGLRRRLGAKTAPFDARYLPRHVVQDWLELLGFQTLTARVVNYQLPHLEAKWRERLKFMDDMGDRWWPTLGAVYVLVVQKKVYSGLRAKRAVRASEKWLVKLKPAQVKTAQRVDNLRASKH